MITTLQIDSSDKDSAIMEFTDDSLKNLEWKIGDVLNVEPNREIRSLTITNLSQLDLSYSQFKRRYTGLMRKIQSINDPLKRIRIFKNGCHISTLNQNGS